MECDKTQEENIFSKIYATLMLLLWSKLSIVAVFKM